MDLSCFSHLDASHCHHTSIDVDSETTQWENRSWSLLTDFAFVVWLFLPWNLLAFGGIFVRLWAKPSVLVVDGWVGMDICMHRGISKGLKNDILLHADCWCVYAYVGSNNRNVTVTYSWKVSTDLWWSWLCWCCWGWCFSNDRILLLFLVLIIDDDKCWSCWWRRCACCGSSVWWSKEGFRCIGR